MASDNNVNELESGNENEASETVEKLSKYAQKKRLKNRYAQIKKKYKISKNLKSLQMQSSEQNPQNKQIFNGIPPQPRGAILTEEEMKKFHRTDKQPNVNPNPATQSVDKLISDIDAAYENDFEYDQYEIKENLINIGNESLNTHTLNMPSYNRLWIKHIEKDAVTQQVRSELNNILKAAGVKENDALALTDDIHGPLSQTVAFDNSIDRKNINMQDIAAKFFKDSYAAIDKAALGPKNRIIAAQKIADLMIKNYSPVAFVRGDELSQYTDKYVAQNKALLKDQLEKLNVQNLNTLIGGVEAALANGFEYDQTEPNVVSNPDQNVNNEQRVTNPEQESLKPRIPDFYQKLGERMDSEDITAQATSEIKDIIKEAGITDDKRIAELSDASYSFVKGQINNIYDKVTVPETKMSKDAPTFFRNAYESLNGSDLSTQAQIIAAQKIANVMLKNYSPVAFIDEGLEQYANDYVLNNRDVFKSQLDMLRLNDAEALMDDVDAAREAERPITNEDTEFTRWLNGRIESTAVFGDVYNELSDILQNAGFTDQEELAKLVRFTQHYGSRTILDAPHLDGDNPNMQDIAVQFFDDSYQMIESAGLSTKDRIITAQKISDVMLKNYSPVASKSEEFGIYADNYVLRNAELLRERLEKLDVKNIDALITDRDIAGLSGSENGRLDMINAAGLRENPGAFMLDKSRNEKAITNISNILVEAGITEDAAQSLEVADILRDAYSVKNIPTASISMREVAKNIFVSTYDALSKKELAPNNKIETTQKIADVILKNYSPIINNKSLSEYADNYVVSDKDLLQESLTIIAAPKNAEINTVVGADAEKKAENTEQKSTDIVNEKDVKDNKPKEAKPQETKPHETKIVNMDDRVAVFNNKLDAFNNMYKLQVDANDFASQVSDAWENLKSKDAVAKGNGRKMFSTVFKSTLKSVIDVEKEAAYKEQRIPEFNDIIKSTNDLLRAAMFAFTDLYHNPSSASLFRVTSFGGLNSSDMVDIIATDSVWKMDHKSDAAWEIQSRDAKDVADKWLKEAEPYEKMINEMNGLVESYKKGTLSKQEMYSKLTAAEWLLVNNEKMMIEDPEDPINPIPNWNNRYWKSITSARESLGIPKHTSMRELIQSNYSEISKAVVSSKYNEIQINKHLLDSKALEKNDSFELQKEQFTIQSKDAVIKAPTNDKTVDEHKNETRWPEPVTSEDEKLKMKNEPKVFSNMVIQKSNEVEIGFEKEDFR